LRVVTRRTAGKACGNDALQRSSSAVIFERVQHATSICGAAATTVAVAMLQGQDEAGIASPGRIAASMGAGLLEANHTHRVAQLLVVAGRGIQERQAHRTTRRIRVW
jgi:hypothetical protein